jgi:hypothetical protein
MNENEIRKAKALYRRYGEALLRDKHLAKLLRRYRSSIETTWETMRADGVVEICTVCSGRKAGSCCFKGAELWYDTVLLLINLLLGVELPDSRDISNGCRFVGDRGCRLLARYYFCINYLCPEIKESIEPSRQKNLMAVAGREIGCGLEVEEAVRRWINTKTA